MNNFLNHVQQFIPLTRTELTFIEENLTSVHYKKNEIIFEEGKVSDTIYFVERGMVRLFYNIEGNQKTAFFYPEGKFICAGESYTFQVPAKENYQTLEEAEIIHLNRDVTEILLQKIPKLEIIARIATEDELITCQKIIASFVCLSPEDRYNELMENNRELFNRVPQNFIASYLGVSAETLSRIKKRVMMRG